MSKTIQDILIKEAFREYVRNKGIASGFVIDSSAYTGLPNKIGCIYKNGKWIVYETDENSKVESEKKFRSAERAFINAASRRNYKLEIPDEYTQEITARSPMLDLRNRGSIIREAIATYERIEELLDSDDEDRSIIDTDIKVLKAELSGIDQIIERINRRIQLGLVDTIEKPASQVGNRRYARGRAYAPDRYPLPGGDIDEPDDSALFANKVDLADSTFLVDSNSSDLTFLEKHDTPPVDDDTSDVDNAGIPSVSFDTLADDKHFPLDITFSNSEDDTSSEDEDASSEKNDQ